jgi:hypothetical protein
MSEKLLSIPNIDYLGGFLEACLYGNLDVVKLFLPHVPMITNNDYEDDTQPSLSQTMGLGICASCMYAQFHVIEYLFSREKCSQKCLNFCITNLLVYLNHDGCRRENETRTVKEQKSMRIKCFKLILEKGGRNVHNSLSFVSRDIDDVWTMKDFSDVIRLFNSYKWYHNLFNLEDNHTKNMEFITYYDSNIDTLLSEDDLIPFSQSVHPCLDLFPNLVDKLKQYHQRTEQIRQELGSILLPDIVNSILIPLIRSLEK